MDSVSDVPAPLAADLLYRRCDAERFSFSTTAELDGDADVTLGQARALAALEFGTQMRATGYNLFVLGPAGSRRHRLVLDFLAAHVKEQPAPAGWCYLNNFADDRKPTAVRLPAGLGAELRRDMLKLVDELCSAIPAAFDSDQYRAGIAEIDQELEERHRTAIEKLQQEAKARLLSLVPTPHGFALAPTRDGELLGSEEFARLPPEEQRRTNEAVEQMTGRLREHIEALPRWQKERRDRVKALSRAVTELAAGQLIDQLKHRYADFPEVLRYLDAVREDVLDNARDFRPSDEPAGPPGVEERRLPRPYDVNVLIDHSASGGPPVIYENNPSVPNVLGRIEHTAQFGALLTNFTMIRPGALHRANGGYLILDAERLLTEPFGWSTLKRVLFAKEIRIESLGQLLSLVSTASLEPDPIPLDVKVILIGERLTYYLLCELDPDFLELFKVAVDLENRIGRTEENVQRYGRLVASLARQEQVRPLTREAVARVIERSARLLGDAEKLTTRLRDISDLLHEADYWAAEGSSALIEAEHVRQAVDSQIQRRDRLRAEVHEEIQRNSILIDTAGAKTGQANGLSVLELGGAAFGKPVRITASVRMGEGAIIDIEREAELGGAIHSKSVLILSSYLTSRYATDRPLSFAASLVFEQSYGGVEGDSASVAEVCALLSAISEQPIKQSMAVTGSVNQHGQVQAIGGVNEKIEAFFDICSARGLSGEQGVLIPKDNVKHLMLRQDVVDAARAGKFAVYAIAHVDEAIAILTGVAAGKRDAAGRFAPSTVNHRVEERLRRYADERAALAERLLDSRWKNAARARRGRGPEHP